VSHGALHYVTGNIALHYVTPTTTTKQQQQQNNNKIQNDMAPVAIRKGANRNGVIWLQLHYAPQQHQNNNQNHTKERHNTKTTMKTTQYGQVTWRCTTYSNNNKQLRNKKTTWRCTTYRFDHFSHHFRNCALSNAGNALFVTAVG
jgi:hypothetical protein